MDWDGVEVHKHAKKNEVNVQPSWPNKHGQKRIYYVEKEHYFLAGHSVIPSLQDSPILPAQVANHSSGFVLSCPLTGQTI